MNSKQSAKRSPASRGCEENKGTAERYREPAFIQELREKAGGYLVGADQYKSSAGGWVPKDVIEGGQLFKAIVFLRPPHENEGKIAQHLPELLPQLLYPQNPKPS